MTEAELHRAISWGLIGLAVPTLAVLLWISAPYGRHERRGWGPTWPARLGWMVMESPSLLGFAFVFGWGEHRQQPVVVLLGALWLIHYGYRVLVFPWWMRMGGKTMPVLISTLAIIFNVPNAYVNARQISHLGDYDVSWAADPRFTTGVAMMIMGFVTHVWADATLRNLRAPGETGYRIPQGGLYRWITCPNYLGEILQWCGWALATWSLPGLAFAIYTMANLAPRARTHHQWYRRQFPDYPSQRRALMPGVW